MSYSKKSIFVFIILVFLGGVPCLSQELYTARGFWQESTKDTYLKIKDKQTRGDSLSVNEGAYVKDYEAYLATYLSRMSTEELQKYQSMKEQWDAELKNLQSPIINKEPIKQKPVQEEFEWRGRDRFVSAAYGLFYGASLVAITGIEGPAEGGIPFITSGLSLLMPVINSKKYEGITRSTFRAGNTGKFLGLLYGYSLGLVIGGDSDNSYKWQLGLSTVGSITMGEIGFQMQKRRSFTDGRIEMVRHYGVLGPWIGFSAFAATETESPTVAGLTMLAGGVAGLLIGNNQAKRYDYTRGDVDAISSLAWITTGLGFAGVSQALENDYSPALILIPAAGSIIGTIVGQRAVRGAYLTKKQGSTINLATSGAALFGLGVVAITESESLPVWFGVPSGLAFITHQIVFHKYKKENLLTGLQGSRKKNNFYLSMRVMPENYLIGKRIPTRENLSRGGSQIINPLFKL